MTGPFVRTRGGLLVVLVVLTAVGFELRTLAAMLFGVDLPAVPYMLAVLVVVAIAGVLMEVSRTSAATGQ
jgi:CHASE2 domain-containing sensor protein